MVKATLFLRSGAGPKPYRTCYFSKREFDRLMSDYGQYQETGSPTTGTYVEDLGTNSEHAVLLEFGAIALIKTHDTSS